MRRVLISIGFVLVLSLSATAQGLYKIQYRGMNNIVYDALMGWYGPQQMSTMRIKYWDPNLKTQVLVEQSLVFVPELTSFTLRGFNARVVYPTQAGLPYFADSFIFAVCPNGSFPCVTAIDDQGLFAYVSEFRGVSPLEAGGLLQNFSFITPATNPWSAPAVNVNSRVTMHLIVVADTNASDIGKGVQIDVKTVHDNFQGIANELGIGFNYKLVAGGMLNRDTVLSAVKELQPGREDLVMFVYTGHGYRLDSDSDSYPRFKLANGSSVSASEVFYTLKGKGARLNVTLVDACNSRLTQTKFAFGSAYSLKGSAPGSNLNALRKLFLTTRANIIVAAADRGEVAWTSDSEGGTFTRTFLDTLRAQTSATNNVDPTWTSILIKTRDLALSSSFRTQNAVYHVE